MEKTFDTVILANGDFPTHSLPLRILHEAPRVVCCDGAINAFPNADIVIGDGDSAPVEFRDRLIKVDEQEDNDLTKATRYCKAQGWHDIAYIAQGEQTFDSMPGQQVSIFNFGSKTITSEGLKWNSYAYQELWQGTLNESLTSHFTIRADGFYMVFRTYLPK